MGREQCPAWRVGPTGHLRRMREQRRGDGDGRLPGKRLCREGCTGATGGTVWPSQSQERKAPAGVPGRFGKDGGAGRWRRTPPVGSLGEQRSKGHCQDIRKYREAHSLRRQSKGFSEGTSLILAPTLVSQCQVNCRSGAIPRSHPGSGTASRDLTIEVSENHMNRSH